MIGIAGVGLAGPLTAAPLLDKSLHIDPDRRYLCDWCAGGVMGVSDLLFSRPEPWAAAVLALRAPLVAFGRQRQQRSHVVL